jgi:hypothetical protein
VRAPSGTARGPRQLYSLARTSGSWPRASALPPLGGTVRKTRRRGAGAFPVPIERQVLLSSRRRACDGHAIWSLHPRPRAPPFHRPGPRYHERPGPRGGPLVARTQDREDPGPRALSPEHTARLRPVPPDRPVGVRAQHPSPGPDPSYRTDIAPSPEGPDSDLHTDGSEDPLPTLPRGSAVHGIERPRRLPAVRTSFERAQRGNHEQHTLRCGRDSARERRPIRFALGQRRLALRPALPRDVRGLGHEPTDPVSEVPDAAPPSRGKRVLMSLLRTAGTVPEPSTGAVGDPSSGPLT